MHNQLSAKESQQPARPSRPHYVFGSLWNMFESPYSADLQNMEPKIEVSENKNNILVTAELPGVSEQDIDLEISANGYLTISGEKRHENTEVSKGGYFSEISYGHVSRTIPLPWDLEYAKAAAEYNNGILTVSIPKTGQEQEKRRKITVNKPKKTSRRQKKKNDENK